MTMRATGVLSGLAAAGLSLLASGGVCIDGRAGNEKSEAAPSKPFAVVELFTSEGCSSCPPADENLARLVSGAAKDGKRVFALSWHVDYWDDLGHKDPFATSSATRRQREYASALNSRGLYTPQIIVNGSAEFVGSDQSRTDREAAAALAKTPNAGLAVTVSRSSDGDKNGKNDRKEGSGNAALRFIRVHCQTTGAGKGRTLLAALVEDGLSTKVTRGENAGRTLRHDHVVRTFVTAPAPDQGSADLAIEPPAGVDLSRCSVVVLLQDGRTMAILAAEAVAPGVK